MELMDRAARAVLKILPPRGTEHIRQQQMLMHPGEPASLLTEKYYVKKTGEVLAILALGILISAAVFFRDRGETDFLPEGALPRNSYGQGDRQVELNLYRDGEIYEKGRIITVGERQYTAEEMPEIFRAVRDEIEKTYLGDNKSALHVDQDLTLPTESAVYPVSLEWLSGDHDVIDMNGHIQDDFADEKGRSVILTAVAGCGESREEYTFDLKVYPRRRDGEEQFRSDMDRMITDCGEATVSQENLVLPKEVKGHVMTYEEAMPGTWIVILAAAVLGAFVLYSGRDSELKKAVAGREREMLLDYPEIVSKLSLLISAGLTLRAAFEKTASDRGADPEEGLSFAKREMMITVHLMKSGMSEYEAYLDFGKRCAVKRYKKLGALLSQNVRKGSAGLIAEMEREARDAFEERKASARRAGEEASTKLLLPMAMMLSVVMIVVIVPAFLSFSL